MGTSQEGPKSDGSDPEMLTVPEVAARLRIGRSAAYDLCKEPGFPTVWVGGVIRVPARKLDEWIESRAGRPIAT